VYPDEDNEYADTSYSGGGSGGSGGGGEDQSIVENITISSDINEENSQADIQVLLL
jgi:hypothetical protein